MQETLSKFKSIINRKVNYARIPVTRLSYSEADILTFNRVYKWLLKTIEKPITRTKSGGICIKEEEIRGNQWDIRNTSSVIELTFKYQSHWYRVQIGYTKKTEEKKLYGSQAWKIFLSICKKHSINMSDYLLGTKEEGLAIKETICKPLIEFGQDGKHNTVYENCHHLDYNSSYAFGITECVPELTPVINELYTKRDIHPEYKDVLAILHGYMQSSGVHYRLSHISKHANQSNRDRVLELAKKLEDSGRKIILFNTDGIWYQGDIYHDENEGKQLGQWKNDYINCKFRARSKGAYEFIGTKVKTNETKYFPVVRGQSSYERIKPREQWEWGDIFKGNVVKYEFIPGVGLINYEE